VCDLYIYVYFNCAKVGKIGMRKNRDA
jgi:hypothetical protein